MAKRLTDIREVEGLPVIGQRYLVPCVQSCGNGLWWLREGEWVPVNGPAHEDADLGVQDVHYHYDFRFISNAQWKRWFDEMPDEARRSLGKIVMSAYVGPWELRPLKCARQSPEFPAHVSRFALKGECTRPVALLEPQFREVRLKPNCRVCPHRGVSLAGLPVDAEGGTVCPGHGLRWNLETGKMMPRCKTTGSEE